MSAPALKLDRWIPLAEAARMAGEPPRRFRRRLHALNRQAGGKLLRHFGQGQQKRRLHVSAEALMSYMRTDPDALDAELSDLTIRVEELESALDREIRKRKAFQAQARRWFKKTTRDHERPSFARGSG